MEPRDTSDAYITATNYSTLQGNIAAIIDWHSRAVLSYKLQKIRIFNTKLPAGSIFLNQKIGFFS
jgi:hypothetical protein